MEKVTLYDSDDSRARLTLIVRRLAWIAVAEQSADQPWIGGTEQIAD
jgi:hypothetical protein